MTIDDNKIWYKTARTIVKAGQLPMVINEALLELIKLIMTEEQAEFIQIFKKPSLSIDQIREKIEKHYPAWVYKDGVNYARNYTLANMFYPNSQATAFASFSVPGIKNGIMGSG